VTLRQADGVRPIEGLQDQRSVRPGFRPDIEGLRAVAVLAVVLFHAEVPGLGGGFVGVDVFFVISGFLITGLLWREMTNSGTVRLRNFYGARARRLLPASAFVGVATMIAAVLLLPPLQVQSVITDGIASALYVSNYWFVVRGVDYFAGRLPPSPFQHYWSLGVEEQFYLLWPALILGTAWLVRRIYRRTRTQAASSQRPYVIVLATVAVMSFTLSFVATYVAPAAAFFSLPTRAWQLAVGGMIALSAGAWKRLPAQAAAIIGWAGLALIVLACTRLTATTLYPGTAALLPTLGTALIIGAGCAIPTKGAGRALGTPPMRAIGQISYSWYLWHWPILIFAPLVLGHPLNLTARLTAALLSALLAIATLRWLENPLRYSDPIRHSARRSLTLGAIATTIAVGVGAILLVAIPTPVGRGTPATPLTITAAPAQPDSDINAYDTAIERAFAQVQAAVAASANLKAVPANLTPPLAVAAAERGATFHGCVRGFFEAGQPECAFGDTASPTTVALIGDSHAAMLIPAFQQIATGRHWRLETLAKAGCPAVDVPITNPIQRLVERLQHCGQWRDQILNRLRVERPQLVVVSIWRQYGTGSARNWQPGFKAYDPAWINSLSRLVRQLRATGAQVLVLGPVPDPESVVPVCLSSQLDDATACAPTRSTAVNQPGIAAEAAATHASGGHYADLTELFCTTDRCPVVIGNALVYVDWSHLTSEYSLQIAPAIATLADRAMANR